MRYLAIDFGRRRLGLAVSDPEGSIAVPYASRQRQGTRRDVADLIETIRGLNAESIVFGLPHNLEIGGAENDSLRLARNFAAALETQLRAQNLPHAIEWWDERFSTTQALHQMQTLGISQREGRNAVGDGSVDARAAANILQSFLDSQKNGGRENDNQKDDH
jgi:putative Holliday junction resolvase